jgi:hypothetical protein
MIVRTVETGNIPSEPCRDVPAAQPSSVWRDARVCGQRQSRTSETFSSLSPERFVGKELGIGPSEPNVCECALVERSQLRAVAGASAPFAQSRDGMTSCLAQDADPVMPPRSVSGLI